jgi:hypothetical protein
MRVTLAALMMASLVCALPGKEGSAEALVAAVRDAMRAGRTDREIALICDRTKLTERLEDTVVEQLQSEGAGLETLEGLDRQRERSRTLASPAQPLKLFDAPAAPSPEEQSQVVGKAREIALQYTAALPNFICTETILRYLDPKLSQTWKARDTLTVAVAYSEKGEQYKLLTINGMATGKKLNSVGGFKSTGEFGTLLTRIFDPKSAARFQWERWTTLRGRMAHVFSYRIEQAHSTYTLNFGSPFKHYGMTSGMRGLVYVDRETHQAMRFSAEADGLPANWPVVRTPSILDYDYADVGGRRYLLPRHVDSRVVLRDSQSRNVMEFGDYRKFSGEATVTFEKQ